MSTAKDMNILVNEGAIYCGNFQNITPTKDFIDGLSEKTLGVFSDKITVSAKPKIREIKNAAQKTKGFQLIDQWNVKISGDLLDFNEKLLETSLFKKEEDGHYVATTGLIGESNYTDVLIVGENLNGDFTIILARDILNTEGLSFDMVGNDNSTFKISLENSYRDRDTIPVEVFSNFKQMATVQA